VTFYYDHRSHWVTDNVSSVVATVAGTFQSELGCTDDWQPGCLATMLTDIDGDGTYTFTSTQIPVGAHEFKVALNESWDVSHPAGNVGFSVSATGETVTISYDASTDAVDVDVEGSSGPQPGDEDLAGTSLRAGLAGERFYFVMPDRFDNGDPSNDKAGVTDDDPLVHGFDPTDKGFYHGGDLAGLTQKLDYLDDMGVTAIWMTPMFKNRWVQGVDPDISAGYHGYWTIDYTQMDPHFGTNAEMEALIAEAHDRGIKVFFDIITNHTADVIKYEEDVYTYRNKAAYPYLDADGVAFDDRDYAGTDTFPELNSESFPYTPTTPDDLATAKVPDWLNNELLYHNRGDSTFAGESSQYGDFFGLDDLFTEHPDVVDGMIDIFQTWITELDIDGYRIDTVKHVNDEFWQAFSPAIQSYAQANGKPEFFFFGEVFDGNPSFTSRYTTELDMPAILDFPFQSAAQQFANGSATNVMRDLFVQDDLYIDEDSNAYSLPTFLGNHDMGRLGYFLQGKGYDDAEMLARSQLAHTLMYLSRGNPVVYYGDEQGFVGDGGDKDARQDMFPSQVPSYNDDDLIGTDATTADDNFDPTHPIYQHLQDLAAVTEAHPALREGLQQHRLSSDGAGVYAFSRALWDDGIEYVVAVNNSTSAQTATIPTYSAGMGFDEIWPGSGSSTTDGDRGLTVTVPPLSGMVLRAQGAVADEAAPAISVEQPPAGSEVTGLIDLSATVGGAAPHQVTFAVRDAASEDWAVVGTDDNAPYRVQYDVSGFETGTTLEVRAILQTRSGDLNADSTTATVGEVVTPPPPGPSIGSEYLVVHYNRADGDYGDPTSSDYNDFWGLHAFGDIDQTVEWTDPVRFWGEDEFGQFAWVKLTPGASNVGIIVHRGDEKDGTDADRFVDPRITPEVWLKSDDETVYTSLAAARGFARIHYHRDDGDYGTWPSDDYNDFWGLHLWGDAIADGEGTDWTAPKPPTGTDPFGVYWDVALKNPDAPLSFIIHRGDTKDVDPDQSFIPSQLGEVWRNEGVETLHPTKAAAENTAVIHYHRPDGGYGDYTSDDFNDFWGMHVWTGAASPNPSWQEPVKPARLDSFGPVFEVPLVEDATRLNFIIHRGDEKDPNADQSLDLATYGHEVWYPSGSEKDNQIVWLLPIIGRGVDADLSQAQAHWVTRDTVLWKAETPESQAYSLRWSPDGGITAGTDGVVGGRTIRLTYDPAGPSDELKQKWPHLADYSAFTVPAAALDRVPQVLQGQVVAVETGSDGALRRATSVQIPGVLDDLYAEAAADTVLGPTMGPGSRGTVRLWAPTAQNVTMLVFDSAEATTPLRSIGLNRDEASGVWSASAGGLKNLYYLFEVTVWAPSVMEVVTNTVTDPYSLALAGNSTKSMFVDLDDSQTKPGRWDRTPKPSIEQFEDVSVYELHVRDFSIDDTTVPARERGTYLAFTRERSAGMAYLAELADAGLTHVHLLPAFDLATVPEYRADQQEPPCDLEALTAAPGGAYSEEQQACIDEVRDTDGFNWGYDPFHYTVPEGSYSTDPDGWRRTREFRQMVQGLNEAGLRVVMDVVYNHTTAAGQDERSVLDRIVPGYYHRLDDKGAVATSTCCSNTATEHAMMEKLMIDSLVTWAREYKVDGFRFDLMGHHSKQNMLNVRAALDELTLESDGVDGKSIYLYGEGWNFGEVANNARFEQATQANMAGTGIGTFSDRLRDAVRGGGPFDANPRIQGFGSGLYTDDNGDGVNGTPADQEERLLRYEDLVKAGLAGNLADFTFASSVTGGEISGRDVDYNGSPAGYTADPSEVVTYVDAHDNETLFDALAFKLPYDTTPQDRARMNLLSLGTVTLSQGPAFFHAGSDLLRSKSLDRNSYNSGDWFNRIDFTGRESTFGSGLPPATDNADKWDFARDALSAIDPPTSTEIGFTSDAFTDLLEIRYSSPLFRLGEPGLIQDRLSYLNEDVPGLIAMRVTDGAGADLDRRLEEVVVVFNATDEEQSVDLPDGVGPLRLHPVQRSGADPIAATASASHSDVTVPARTVSVFVR
jgi:pullulanase-type alpha-1,6-glucosidase